METTQSIQSVKDITNRWLENVGNHLFKLQECELFARDGCKSITEFVVTPIHSIQEIQIKNIDMFISEMEMTLQDVASVVEETKLKTINEEFNKLKDIRNKGIDDKDKKHHPIFEYVRDDSRKTKHMRLTTSFKILVRGLGKLRGELVESLKHILWIQKEEISALNNLKRMN